MIAALLGRYIRYWYTYRIAVALVIAVVLSGGMFWLYTQQLVCDVHSLDCHANVSVHPEDRFAPQYDPGKPNDGVLIVGIDNASLQTLNSYPIPRGKYAAAIQALSKAGAAAVGFDINFPDRSDPIEDKSFHDALVATKTPVILAYGAGAFDPDQGKYVQSGVNQIPIRDFRCADIAGDKSGPCSQPLPNVILASPDLALDYDGVVRRVPLVTQPSCYPSTCSSTPLIDTFGRVYMQADDWHTDAVGYDLIAHAVANSIGIRNSHQSPVTSR